MNKEEKILIVKEVFEYIDRLILEDDRILTVTVEGVKYLYGGCKFNSIIISKGLKMTLSVYEELLKLTDGEIKEWDFNKPIQSFFEECVSDEEEIYTLEELKKLHPRVKSSIEIDEIETTDIDHNIFKFTPDMSIEETVKKVEDKQETTLSERAQNILNAINNMEQEDKDYFSYTVFDKIIMADIERIASGTKKECLVGLYIGNAEKFIHTQEERVYNILNKVEDSEDYIDYLEYKESLKSGYYNIKIPDILQSIVNMIGGEE